MTNSNNPPPEQPNFPDPRPLSARRQSLSLRPSIDARLMEEQDIQEVTNQMTDLEIEDRAAALREEASALEKREREHSQMLAETLERIRIVRETEILLANRERLLDKREAVLSSRRSNQSADDQIAALEQSLKETQEMLDTTNRLLEEKEEVITGLRAEKSELETNLDQATAPVAEQDEPPSQYDGIAHESLAEQVAFLKEREAFIEQSENVLFEKAQNLQEWETRLQQIQHDQVKAELQASLGDKMNADGPIEFPRPAASNE